MRKSETTLSFTESPSFEARFDEALAELLRTETNVIEIPDSNGMKLVRDETPEADERKTRTGVVLITKQKGEQNFLVCLN